MAFLDEDRSGIGTLHTASATDPTVFLVAGVTYFATGLNAHAIVVPETVTRASRISIAGTVQATDATAIRIFSTTIETSHNIAVLGTGTVIGELSAIAISEGFPTLINAGTIFSYRGNGFVHFTSSESASARVQNSGLIQSFASHAVYAHGSLELINTGTIASSGASVQSWQDLTVRNFGLITGGVGAYGYMHLINRGTIGGSIVLGDGGYVDTIGGTVLGDIRGSGRGDTYLINGTETIREGQDNGIDTVYSAGDYRLAANLENLILVGKAQVGRGNALDNEITAAADDSQLFGGGGNDILRDGDGDDTLNGGEGDDLIMMVAGANTVIGGAGVDAVSFVDIFELAEGVTVSLTAGTVSGAGFAGTTLRAVENVVGTYRDDTLIGDARANVLSGHYGDDVLRGQGGDDILFDIGGEDLLDGGAGFDVAAFAGRRPMTINLATGIATETAFDATVRLVSIEATIGTAGDDRIVGSAGANRLEGAGGNDTLSGGKGQDVLVGGEGDDRLSGGTEADIFLFASDAGSGRDLIADFEVGVDKISFVGGGITVATFSALSFSTNAAIGGIDITSAEGVISLRGVSLGQLSASDFLFDPVI